MKKLFLITAFILAIVGMSLGQSTTTLTPDRGSATYSAQAITNNNIITLLGSGNTSTLDQEKGIDTLNQSLRVSNLRLDSIVTGSKSYIATLTFTASSAAGAYSNLQAISSSTATASSFSLSVPSGKYELIAVNCTSASTATPIFEGWIFTSSVTTAGDKQNISGVLSDSDMSKFVGDVRFAGTFVGNGTVNKSNGTIGSGSGNIPIILNITGNAMHIIFIARTGFTPSPSAVYRIIFYLKRDL